MLITVHREPLVTVRAVSIEHDKDGVSVVISSNGALIPTVTKLDGPPRLVIDIAGAVNGVAQQKIPIRDDEIKGIRISQYQQLPPVTRLVLDLAKARNYEWETEPDRLVVHLRPVEGKSGESAPSVPAFTSGVRPAITSATGAAVPGAVLLAGNRIPEGSSVTAGADTTVLNLGRGGQVLVCPGTTISVTTSRSGRDLMLGMSTGSVEAHYQLSASADSIVTPDFRILLPGPGEFHYAVSADSRGDTCVRSLPGNTASAVVSELMGDGTYQVKPTDQLVFRGGQLSKADHQVPMDCGCPPAREPVMRAEAAETAPQQAADLVTSSPGESEDRAKVVLPSVPISARERDELAALPKGEVLSAKAATPPAVPASDVHIEVEAPLVYRASSPPPIMNEEAAHLPVVSRTSSGGPMRIVVLPPTANTPPVAATPQPKPPQRGFFGKIRHFFSTVFG